MQYTTHNHGRRAVIAGIVIAIYSTWIIWTGLEWWDETWWSVRQRM